MMTTHQASDKDDVSTALGLLRDSLAEEELRIRNEGAKTMQSGEYDTATSVIEFGKSIRWRNAAQWARNTMVNEDGRMVKNGKNGVWEISDKGRKWLSSQRV
jgi:hypothetical protein